MFFQLFFHKNNLMRRCMKAVSRITSKHHPADQRSHPKLEPEAGQATVEFIMLIPILLVVMLALCQTALALCCYLGVHHASREGVRKGVETNDSELAKRYARSAASWLPGAGENLKVSVRCPKGNERGNPMEVEVEYRMPLLFPFLENLIPGDIRFQHATTMNIERSRQR